MPPRNLLIIGLLVVAGLLLAILFELHTLAAVKRQEIDFQHFEQQSQLVRPNQTKSEELLSSLEYLQSDFGPHGRFRPANWLRRHLFGQRWMCRWGPDQKWRPAEALEEQHINTELETIATLERAVGAKYAQ